MITVYTGEIPPDSFTSSIFLAGPSPRTPSDSNWRTEAIKILEGIGYKGVVFAPVYRDKPTAAFDYDKQVEWERQWLNTSDQIVFWVPRDLKTLPGFTTNVEYGMHLRSGKILLGSPEGAPKMDYLEWWAGQEGVENFDDLKAILGRAVEKLGKGALRSGGEREVPLHLWEKPEFQTWVTSQKAVGNRLDGAELVWAVRVGKNKAKTFLWALHVNVWIDSESRSKVNEVVIFRPDISAILAYCRPSLSTENDWLLDTEVVLVREFRSPVNNTTSMVNELPGGSSMKPDMDPITVAASELEEETGLVIPESRFKYVGLRQLASTLSAHRAHVYAVEMTPEEILSVKWAAGTAHGNHENGDSEYTFSHVTTVRDMLRDSSIDWSNLGMVFHVLSGKL
jgi:8-oxo-dGTP pyrophosphatase MutT (NUDIX family)